MHINSDMAESLKFIALISGGKDSIYSILHCLENGHKVVALGNLYPSPPNPKTCDPFQPNTDIQNTNSDHDGAQETKAAEEHDLNSFMYQTVGHSVIPLYEQALGIPLYRQPILGTALQTGASYMPSAGGNDDETESLVPLLKTIMAAHPDANALSTGAILSTYQRTRIESVAVRLGLIPLAYLWQYPALPPGAQTSLLEDMASASLEARIVKVASGGLDESFLWEDVASEKGMRRVERAVARFGMSGDGAVLGEGGEFETLVLDGPDDLFKGRILVEDEDRRVVREGGGAAWLSIRNARVEIKEMRSGLIEAHPRRPELLESRFTETLEDLQGKATSHDFLSVQGDSVYDADSDLEPLSAKVMFKTSIQSGLSQQWMISASEQYVGDSVDQGTEGVVEQLRSRLRSQSAELSDVISVVILLRFMKDFPAFNKVSGYNLNVEEPQRAIALLSPKHIHTFKLIYVRSTAPFSTRPTPPQG
jgi:uncharacterized protein (TIGR00290 family)